MVRPRDVFSLFCDTVNSNMEVTGRGDQLSSKKRVSKCIANISSSEVLATITSFLTAGGLGLAAQCPLPSDFAEEPNSFFKFSSQTVHQPKAISVLVLSEVAEVGPGSVKVASAISVPKTCGIAASDDMVNASVTGWQQAIYSVYAMSGDGVSRAGLSRSEKCFRSLGVGFQVRLFSSDQLFWLQYFQKGLEMSKQHC